MTKHRFISPALAAFYLLTAGCGAREAPDCSTSSSASSSTGGINCIGTAKIGAPCVTDCDCCGKTCATLTAADGTVSKVCSAPCPVAP